MSDFLDELSQLVHVQPDLADVIEEGAPESCGIVYHSLANAALDAAGRRFLSPYEESFGDPGQNGMTMPQAREYLNEHPEFAQKCRDAIR